MPGYKAHLLCGVAVGAGAVFAARALDVYRPEPLQMLALTAITAAAALFPDVDTNSVARRFFYGLLAALDIVLISHKRYEWAALVGLASMLPAIGDHRGWTHTWWAMLAVPLVIFAVPASLFGVEPRLLVPYLSATVLGYGTHLVLDRQF